MNKKQARTKNVLTRRCSISFDNTSTAYTHSHSTIICFLLRIKARASVPTPRHSSYNASIHMAEVTGATSHSGTVLCRFCAATSYTHESCLALLYCDFFDLTLCGCDGNCGNFRNPHMLIFSAQHLFQCCLKNADRYAVIGVSGSLNRP